ncbi:hypothetical protein E2562_012939 [Oryza meyeriana var. granulata]|uniref:Uncharacterized protein n=1 Tax=Oryza meyeriana var. granulata TaxID=110450 RepID=A0A6G1DJW1_9ORYZ|nr:hypothetical protein E2562_012939 [Oryza meyeriana var. granulata]
MTTSSGTFGVEGCVAGLTTEVPFWSADTIIFRTFSTPSSFRRQDLGGIVSPPSSSYCFGGHTACWKVEKLGKQMEKTHKKTKRASRTQRKMEQSSWL